MSSQELEQLRERARSSAETLASLPAVEGVCLFGSVARGDAHATSDIDLLVIGTDDDLTLRSLRRMLPAEFRAPRLSLSYYGLREMRKLLAVASPFTMHLRSEAIILYDRNGIFPAMLRDRSSETAMDVTRELGIRLKQLKVYDDLGMFRGNFLFALSHLYSVGKSVVMLDLAAAGTPEFNREAAFARFTDAHPEMAVEVTTVARLRPFFLRVNRQASEPEPFPPHGAEHEVRAAVAAIRRLAEALE